MRKRLYNTTATQTRHDPTSREATASCCPAAARELEVEQFGPTGSTLARHLVEPKTNNKFHHPSSLAGLTMVPISLLEVLAGPAPRPPTDCDL